MKRERPFSDTWEPLIIDPAAFCDGFNRRPFLIKHHLAGHPLFELPRLIEMARRLPPGCVRYSGGMVGVGDGLYGGPKTGLTAEETIRQIEECGSWMVIKFVERDPEYRQLLDDCLDQVAIYSEPLDPGMCRREGFIFISSPRAITPYHMDPEYNFLLQIRGRKTMRIWDSEDRSVLSDVEIEDYLARGFSQLVYHQEYEAKARSVELEPGLGVHVPLTAPHWVQNGDQVSISFSITFRTPASEQKRMVSHTNAYLRRAGLAPLPHGQSPLRDAIKCYTFRTLFGARQLLGGRGENSSSDY